MIRNADDLSQSEVEDLIRDCFAILKEPMDRPFIPSSNEPWLDREEQKALSQEHASGLASEVDQRNFSDETVAKAASLVGELEVSLDGVSRDRLIAVVEGIARAVIEADRVFIHRIEDTVTTYSPVDPIFRGPERNKLDGVGLTVSELIQTYIKAHHNTWTPKTTRSRWSNVLPTTKASAAQIGQIILENRGVADAIRFSHIPSSLMNFTGPEPTREKLDGNRTEEI